MNIVCIGDSLTFGYDVDETSTWVSLLSQKTSLKIFNKGIPGNTTSEMLQRFFDDVISVNPSIVFIMGGTNDIFLNSDLDSTLFNIKSMIYLCKKNNITPIILTPLPVNENITEKTWFIDSDYKIINNKLSSFRTLLKDYSFTENVILIDICTILSNMVDTSTQFLVDGIHVSGNIHNIISNVLLESLIKYNLINKTNYI